MEEWEERVSAWWEERVVRVRESSVLFWLADGVWKGRSKGKVLFSALSASRTRRSRACWRVLRDSLMRATASLSGVILKLPIVWWMS